MLRILHDTNYDFIRWWKVMAAITIAFILLGLGSLAIKRPNWSIEFTGGTLMQLQFTQPPDVGEIRSALDDAGIRGAEIQQFGSNRDFTVRAQNPSQVAAQARGAESIAVTIEAVLKKKFGENNLKVGRTEAVGPRVGQELKRGAIIAILLSFLITLVYLSIRFEWRFADADDRLRARGAGAGDYLVAVAVEGRVREVGVAVDEDRLPSILRGHFRSIHRRIGAAT